MSRFRLHRNEEGQGLIIVISIAAVCAILLGAIEVSVLGDANLAATATSQEQALQAANSGLADYETWVNGSANEWDYAEDFCSSGTFPGGSGTLGCTNNADGTALPLQPAIPPTGENDQAHPDPNNPAFVGVPDPNCATSAYNASSGSPGQADYYGWVTLHGSTTGGYAEQYQYIVDSSSAFSLGGYAHVWVTGRAGTSHHYTCSTIKVLYNGPQLTNVNTVQLAPASCSGTTLSVPAPAAATNIAEVQIVATGGTGQTGGSAGLSEGGGTGGSGETVEATYAASNTTTLSVNIGCQGGSTSSILAGGPGFASGGTVPSGGNAGGGGGATAVCAGSVSPCTSANVNTSSALTNDVYMIVGGGGGGGEGVFGATAAGGNAGSGVTANVTSGVAESGGAGSNAKAWFQFAGGGTGGPGGSASAGYSPAGGAGTHVDKLLDADGGGGGAGYNGGTGGTVGFGGGGGGAGASFYNTNTSSPSGGIGAYVSGVTGTGFNSLTDANQPSNYGSVTITWEDVNGNPVGPPVVPAACGPYAERTTQIPALTDVSLEVSGGSGGYGNDLSLFGSLFQSSPNEQEGGVGTSVVATYFNSSQSPVDVTAIQGCQGQIAGGEGDTPGGDGLRTTTGSPPPTDSGGDNCGGCTGTEGDSGSGGGASAMCVGTIAPGSDSPTNNNCTGASSLLMVAGGGGGGGGVSGSWFSLCTGGNGGAGGGGVATDPAELSDWPNSTNLMTGGIAGDSGQTSQGGWCASVTPGAGGSASTSAYAPTGQTGNATTADCSGDGGAGGGGMVGGAAGQAGAGYWPGLCIVGGAGGGGGGGSSYLAPSNGSLELLQCKPGGMCLYSPCPGAGQADPATNQTNTSTTVSVDEGEWCPGQLNTDGTASITDTAVPDSASVLSQTPAAVPSSTSSVLW